MTSPGWYPDPDGSGSPRYWDGQAWADNDQAPHQTRSGNRGFLLLVAGLVVVALVVAVMVFQPWKQSVWGSPGDTNSARPTGSQWNELEPSESPTSQNPAPNGGRPVACPIEDYSPGPEPQNGWYSSGGMKYQGVPGWMDEGGWTIDFATERSGQQDRVSGTWVSVTAIGQLSKQKYSSEPQTAAQQLIDCMSTSYYYRDLDRVETLENAPFTTSDGVSGWLIRANFWNIPGTHDVSGDEVVVVVVDQGADSTLTLFHTQAPIEDPARQDLVQACLDSLQRA